MMKGNRMRFLKIVLQEFLRYSEITLRAKDNTRKIFE